MRAILSDVHGNLEALQAVLADVARHRVEAVYCLGDVVGYGPDPVACLDLAMSWDVVLRGNHEHAVLNGPDDFTFAAERALLWTVGQLQAAGPGPESAQRRLAFLDKRPAWHREDDVLFVHATARNPLVEYLFPEDADDPDRMRAIFAWVPRLCFQGHTHAPGIFTDAPEFLAPEEVGYEYRLGGQRAMINVGSVGQPRDGDPRACYVLLDGDTVHFRRVEYDVETTVGKIHAALELPPWLGDRLREGR